MYSPKKVSIPVLVWKNLSMSNGDDIVQNK